MEPDSTLHQLLAEGLDRETSQALGVATVRMHKQQWDDLMKMDSGSGSLSMDYQGSIGTA